MTFEAKLICDYLLVTVEEASSKRLLNYFFFDADFLRGTLPPAFRASESPIAIACFLLVTFFLDRPLFKVPSFRSCIAFSTFSDAFLPYLAMFHSSFESSC